MTAADPWVRGAVPKGAQSSGGNGSGAQVPKARVPVPESGGATWQGDDEGLARLPGPRRHLDLLEADLLSGRSCVWYFPDPFVESGRADFFVDELAHRMEGVIAVPGAVSLTDRDPGPSPSSRVPLPDSLASLDATRSVGGADFQDDPYGDLLSDLVVAIGAEIPKASPSAPVPASTLQDRLAKELGVTGDPVVALADQAAAGLAPHTVFVRCWNETSHEEAARVLRVAVATFHEAGLSGRAQPRFLFAARAGDLPRHVLGDPSRSSVHWWWKVWNRLDTEVLMAWQSRGHTDNPAGALLRRVMDAVVAEVCGPDIDRALVLRDAWGGGDLDSLRAALAGVLPDEQLTEAEYEPSVRMSAAHAWAPDAEIHDAWADGAVDSWDGRIRLVHGRRLLDSRSHELRVLVCHAQNRVLLPLIEEARTALIHLLPELLRKGRHSLEDFCAKARSQYKNKNGGTTALPDLHELEIGGLSAAAYMLNLTSSQRHRLRSLHTARNTLSHRTPLGHEDLVALTKVLTTDWTAK
ncbi:hypothetical protein [Streptomyces sp. NBC_00566]|uniref:hypothetical protein n=1 Tax=Streptomyces sp. NBC_00566 TaxID=2975778 RepID=UPI002E811136|nr:hypothetical protein [Streptomyces sp. NBC_00566]WUB89981.1 hypothetical protein OG812_26760 [Streptomyces sp. NBC_00566]